jgi:prepilin-type N-terminal cleavage/methylation domain-containing protein
MILKRQRALQKNRKKGFTLVELIVVVVILAILAAVAAPAMLGYVEKTRQDTVLTEAATIRTALQTVVTDAEAKGVSEDSLKEDSSLERIVNSGALTAGSSFNITHGVNQLIGANYAPGGSGADGEISDLELDSGTVTEFTFVKNGVTVTYSGGAFTVS